MRQTSAKKLGLLLYLLLGVVGVLNMYSATIFSGFNNIQADQVDTLFNAYILEHGYRAFFDPSYKFHFFSPPFYYPKPEMLFESDNLLGSAPIYWLVRSFSDWTFAFQMWGIIQTILTYVAMLVLLLFLGINPIVAGLSGYVFAFGMPRIAQLSHPQIFAQFYMCIALIFLFKFLNTVKHRYFNLFMLFLTLQFVAGFYLGWFFSLSLLIAFFLYGVFATENFRKIVLEVRSHWRFYLGSLSFWGLINVAFWFKYFVNGGQYKLITVFLHALEVLNSPESYLTPVRGSLWSYVFVAGKSISQENYIFPGIGFYLMVIITAIFIITPLLRFQDPRKAFFVERFKTVLGSDFPRETLSIIRVSFFTGLILNLITTSILDQSIWLIVAMIVPGAEAIRYAARIWVVSHIWFYISGGLTLTYLISKVSKPRLSIGIVLLIVFFIAEQFVIKPTFISKNTLLASLNKGASSLLTAPEKCDFAYFSSKEVFYDENGPTDGSLKCIKDIEAMWTSLYTGIPTINGYTAWIKYALDREYTVQDLSDLTQRPGETVCVYNEDGLKATTVLPEISRKQPAR